MTWILSIILLLGSAGGPTGDFGDPTVADDSVATAAE